MQLYTFTAPSLAEAMRLVREELGPDASLLHTREIGSTLARLLGSRTIEVTAAAGPCAPSRLHGDQPAPEPAGIDSVELQDYRWAFRNNLARELEGGASLVEQLATARSRAIGKSGR
jgi:flagellar biosynthesis protein FlhF